MRSIDFSPMIVIKEEDGTRNSAIVVDNGPQLMEDTGGGKEYTRLFSELIEEFPSVLTATFYNKNYTSYRIKIEGERDMDILGIRNFLAGEEE